MKRHNPDWTPQLAYADMADGRFRKARWNPGGRSLELLLRLPSPDGWSEVLLRYRNVERLDPALPRLAALVEDPAVRLTGHELVAAAGSWQHRLYTDTGTELRVRFADLDLDRRPVAGPEEAVEGGHRFEVLSC